MITIDSRLWRTAMEYDFGMGRLLCLGAILLSLSGALNRPTCGFAILWPAGSIDSDQDGLTDDLEQALLTQFRPVFMVSQTDCSSMQAEFTPRDQTQQYRQKTPPYMAKSSLQKPTARRVPVEIHSIIFGRKTAALWATRWTPNTSPSW